MKDKIDEFNHVSIFQRFHNIMTGKMISLTPMQDLGKGYKVTTHLKKLRDWIYQHGYILSLLLA